MRTRVSHGGADSCVGSDGTGKPIRQNGSAGNAAAVRQRRCSGGDRALVSVTDRQSSRPPEENIPLEAGYFSEERTLDFSQGAWYALGTTEKVRRGSRLRFV